LQQKNDKFWERTSPPERKRGGGRGKKNGKKHNGATTGWSCVGGVWSIT